MDRISFGIGCYMFEAPKEDWRTFTNETGRYRISDWARDVRKALESIPSIDMIEINEPRGITGSGRTKSILEESAEVSQGDRKFHPGGSFTPNPSDGSVSFRVTIPQHIQERLSRGRGVFDTTVFDVDMRFDVSFPVTFVSVSGNERRPSTAVMIVREFLREEFQQRENQVAPIKFSCMGPSPFWANCWADVSTDEAGEPGIEARRTLRRGYDEIVFVGSAKSPDELFRDVKREAVREIALFYSLVAERNLVQKHDYGISLQLDRLIELQENRGIRSWLKRMRHSGRDSLSLSLQVLYAENRATRFRERFTDTLESHYALHPSKPFESWINAELKRMESSRRGEAREMVGLLAKSHSNTVQVVAVVAASLTGGIAGAALTALAGSAGS